MLGWQRHILTLPPPGDRPKPPSRNYRRGRDKIEAGDEAESLSASPSFSSGTQRKSRPRTATGPRKLNAAEIGAAHHKFLQHVELAHTANLVAEADRLAQENMLAPEERAALDFEALTIFCRSRRSDVDIRTQRPDSVKRELPFTARFRLDELAAMTNRALEPIPGDEFVVVQGVVDLVVLRPDEIWLVDFKTDRVRPGDLAAKSKLLRSRRCASMQPPSTKSSAAR